MYLETLIRRSHTSPKLLEVARRWLKSLTLIQGTLETSGEALTLADPFPILRDAVLDRAYTKAAYILGDTKRARKVALDVATSLEVPYQIVEEASFSTDKPAHQYKVKEPSLLLDQLIYKKTTVHEHQQELEHRNGGRQLDEETMIIRFVKNIVEYSITYNTLYTVTGLHRVLFNYPVHDARTIYQLLVPHADDKKPGSDDFRHHKKRFMDSLAKRFKSFVEIVEYGDQGELRFKKCRDSRRYYGLVKQTLDLLMPSLPECPPLPDKLENMDDVRRSLYSHASTEENDDENSIERTRMHMLTHLFCFSRLQGLLNLAPAEHVLEIPAFNMTNHGGNSSISPPFDRQTVPKLTTEDSNRMHAEIDKRRKRGKKIPPEKVEVVVDEIERGTLSLDESQPVHFELEEGAGIIEFRGSDEEGSLPLGMHSLSWDESLASGEPESYRMQMKGGREVRFTIAQTRDINGAVVGAKVHCTYSQVRQPITVPAPLSVMRDWLSHMQPRAILQSPLLRQAVVVIGILTLGTGLYLRIRESPGGYRAGHARVEIALPAALSAADAARERRPVDNNPNDQSKSQVASLPERASTATPRAGAKKVKPFINETITVRTDAEPLVTDYSILSLPTLSSGIDRSVTGTDPTGVIASGTEAVTLPVTKRTFVKLTELQRANSAVNIDPSAFLSARRIFIKPFTDGRLSQVVYSNLIKDLQANRYSISNDVYSAEAILEGKVEERGSSVTLSVLLNNSDGSMVWLKSINSRNKDGDVAAAAADLSAKAVKSLSEARQEDAYVALDYLARAASMARHQSSTTLPVESGGDMPYKQSGGETAITSKVPEPHSHADN